MLRNFLTIHFFLVSDPDRSRNGSCVIKTSVGRHYRPICRPTYRPSIGRYVGRHFGRYSVDMLADSRSTYRSVCRWALGRRLGRSVAIDCRWCIGRLSVVSKNCSPLFCWKRSHLLTHRGRERWLYRLCSCVDRARCSPNFPPFRIHINSQFYSRVFAFVSVELRTERPKKDDSH